MRSKLRALEKNILKYRALQMVLLLHQVESLRSFVLGSIRATDTLGTRGREARVPEGTKRPMQKALSVLESLEIVSSEESADIQRIIEIRNTIGHAVHDLLADVSAPRLLRRQDPVYDYFALNRFQRYRRKIERGMMKHFVLQASFRDLLFEQAELTFREELVRLRIRIEKQYQARRAVA